MALTAPPTAPTSSSNVIHPSLPQRPSYNFAANADSIGLGAAPTPQSIRNAPTAAQAFAGSNRDVVANRRAIRMANMSAAEVLKAQLNGLSPVKPSAKDSPVLVSKPEPMTESNVDDDLDGVPGLGALSRQRDPSPSLPPPPVPQLPRSQTPAESDADADAELDPDTKMLSADSEAVAGEVLDIPAGAKRKFEDGPGSDEPAEDVVMIEEDEDDPTPSLTLKVNSDGTAEQEDHVKLV
jgi:5'-3' exoribonuclease 2